MLLAISKTLPPLLFPVGLTILLCLLAAWLAYRKGAAKASLVSVLAAALLYLAASPIVSHKLLSGLESRHPPTLDNPEATAIVLLGGSILPDLPPRLYPETNWAGDRLIHAGRLWRQGLAPLMVPTGGYISYVSRSGTNEASLYMRLLEELFDVPRTAMLPVPHSRTTREDAVQTAELFEEHGLAKEILLVTSASHMPRSVALFRAQGFTVHPAPTDFHAATGLSFQLYDLLPSGSALAETYMALHEYTGLLVYRLLGWF